MKETSLTRMYGLFEHEKQTGKVYKNKFWSCAEHLGANLHREMIDDCFKLFDRQGKGYFTFIDFTRVSKLVQGYEIDQVFNMGDKLVHKATGKRCKGYAERLETEYDNQRMWKERAQILSKSHQGKRGRNSRLHNSSRDAVVGNRRSSSVMANGGSSTSKTPMSISQAQDLLLEQESKDK